MPNTYLICPYSARAPLCDMANITVVCAEEFEDALGAYAMLLGHAHSYLQCPPYMNAAGDQEAMGYTCRTASTPSPVSVRIIRMEPYVVPPAEVGA